MRKTFLIVAITLTSLTTYSKTWVYNCSGGGKVYFTTSEDTTPR